MVDIGIVNNSGIVDNIYRLSGRVISAIGTGIDITTGDKRPPGVRRIIT